jgi:CcmD family protein
MRILRTVLALLAFVVLFDSSAGVVRAQQPPPQPQTEFVPIDQLPPQDQLPAAPLLVTAYVVVIAIFFAYLVSIARRMSAVQREMEQLESSVTRGRRE